MWWILKQVSQCRMEQWVIIEAYKIATFCQMLYSVPSTYFCIYFLVLVPKFSSHNNCNNLLWLKEDFFCMWMMNSLAVILIKLPFSHNFLLIIYAICVHTFTISFILHGFLQIFIAFRIVKFYFFQKIYFFPEECLFISESWIPNNNNDLASQIANNFYFRENFLENKVCGGKIRDFIGKIGCFSPEKMSCIENWGRNRINAPMPKFSLKKQKKNLCCMQNFVFNASVHVESWTTISLNVTLLHNLSANRNRNQNRLYFPLHKNVIERADFLKICY